MPFQFDPAKYKNIFDGEFGDSPLQPQQNRPGEEVWNVKIYKLRDTGNGNLEKYTQNQPCQICGDNLHHEHQWLYESERPSSPTAQFIFSLRDHGGVVINEPKTIEGRRFRFEEKIFKGGTNPQTGLPGKDRRYFFVIGPVGYEPDESSGEESMPNNPQPAASNPAPANNPTANGSVAAASIDDLLKALARISDGKSDLNEIRQEAKSTSIIFDSKPFYISVLNGMAFESLVQNGFAVKDENGVFHAVGA